MRVLLTGGAGYIGSHTAVVLAAAGHEVVVLDDLSNSKPQVLDRMARVVGRPLAFERADVADVGLVRAALERHRIEAVIHFAAFKAARGSLEQPLEYYRNNVGGLIALLQAMGASGCRTLLFSGSAAVYGDPEAVPVREEAPLRPANPYAWTKLIGERLLADVRAADPHWRIAIARYFNPAGAHPSGGLGEDPVGEPQNLMPKIVEVARGRQPFLEVYGDDFPTPDGSGVRDYIHVMDLAEGHVAMLDHLVRSGTGGTFNLGLGRGHSVLEVVRCFESVNRCKVAVRIAPRRAGDPARCFADPGHAQATLGWRATRTLEDMCASAWHGSRT